MSEAKARIEEFFRKPSSGYPMGSYLKIVAGRVEIATGEYEKQYPGHPSPYPNGWPPFVIFDCGSRELGTLWWSKVEAGHPGDAIVTAGDQQG